MSLCITVFNLPSSPDGTKIIVKTNIPPNTIDQRSVTELTKFSKTIISAAPTTPPNNVPIPPIIAISNPLTDCDKETVVGLTKLFKKAYKTPAIPAIKPEKQKPIVRCSVVLYPRLCILLSLSLMPLRVRPKGELTNLYITPLITLANKSTK